MPYISLKMTQPEERFILTRDLHFNTIKITDITCDINGFAPLLTNVLLQLNEYNENHFVFADAFNNNDNTECLKNLPIIVGQKFSYSPVAMSPPDYENETQQHTRYLRLKGVGTSGQAISAADWGTSVLHINIYFG